MADYDAFPEHRELFLKTAADPRDSEYEPQRDLEMDRERLHWDFEVCCREFAATEVARGVTPLEAWSAVFRAVARAMSEQPDLLVDK